MNVFLQNAGAFTEVYACPTLRTKQSGCVAAPRSGRAPSVAPVSTPRHSNAPVTRPYICQRTPTYRDTSDKLGARFI